ncbi:ATP-grasp domain-containing protein [Streptomyces sp. NPDC003035]|uniref:ATP-grasp domain-containing protein n=1 Tax=Streptomyces sp. NPDC003035 TaxID=3364676 RepID=UPI003679D533
MSSHLVFVESNMSGSGFEALAAAKRMGHRVSFLTCDLSYYVGGVGETLDTTLIDRVACCDTDDVEAVLAAVREVGRDHPVDAVLTMSEWHVAVTAAAARRLGLAGSEPDAVAAARDKSRTRTLCQAAAVPIPAFRRVERTDTLDDADIPVPCIVKPVDELLSIGVKLCASAAEARAHVRHLLEERSQIGYRGRPRTPAVLIEEYLDGPEYSVETLTYEGTTSVLSVTRKLLSPPPAFVETGHAVPAPLDPDVRTACEEVAAAALAAIGYTFGSAHIELRVTAAGPKLIEVNCRPGGDRITRLVTLATGIDMVAEQIGMHLGRRPELTGRTDRGAAIVFLPSTAGRVDEITGTVQARAHEGVVDVQLYVETGTETGSHGDNTDRFGHVIAVGPTSTAALQRAEAAAQSIAFTVAAAADAYSG